MLVHADKTTFDEHIKSIAVADFFTTGCPICEKLAPIFESMARIRGDISFLKVNLDEDITLAERYAISHVPAVMLFSNGELVRSKVGYMDSAELAAFIDREEVDRA